MLQSARFLMEANPTQIINYFSGFKQNLVPLYQRPYTWSEKQWRTLWDDITSFYSFDPSSPKSTHFMGAIVTMPARSVPVGVSKFMVIDGQQRLTTIAIIMCAVRDALKDSADEVHCRTRIQSFYLTNNGYEGTDFYKLLPTQGDRDPYAVLIKGPGTSIPESQFKKAYDFFRRKLREQVPDESCEIDPKRILEIIESHLMVVMINLSEADDPYLIFESLNFKGSPLEQADLVRNYFLMKIPTSDQQAVYEHLWLPMQNRLGASLTEFMRHFLGSEGKEVRKNDVYADIKRLVASEDSSVRVLMTRMERLSVLYSRIASLAPEPNAELKRYFDHFHRLDFGSVYPLLLSLYEHYDEGQFSLGHFIQTLGVLHSYIIRRMVVGVPSNPLSGVFISLSGAKPETDSPATWLAASLGREDKNRRWPNDTEFEERWMRAQIYGSRACQVILECLEEDFAHHEAASFDNSSIEHIMPQTLTPEWIQMLGPDAERHHSELLYTLGNLTLSGYNQSMSNGAFAEKQLTFARSHYEVNRVFGTLKTWGVKEIQDRASALFRTAVQLWPGPPASNSNIFDSEGAKGTVQKALPAGFHVDCISLVEEKLGIHLSKLSQKRYQSGDGQVRLTCAVSAEHNETAGVPYFWFAFQKHELDFLQKPGASWICLGCGSAATTLLVPLSLLQTHLDDLSVSRNEERHYWHIVVQKKAGRLILRLLRGTDGPDLTSYSVAKNLPKTEFCYGDNRVKAGATQSHDGVLAARPLQPASPGTKIKDKVREVFDTFPIGQLLTRDQILEIVENAFPGTNKTSVLPSDYCYNIVNAGIDFDFHLFEYNVSAKRGEPQYKYLGPSFDYEGPIYWKDKVVGEWIRGEASPRKGEQWPKKSR